PLQPGLQFRPRIFSNVAKHSRRDNSCAHENRTRTYSQWGSRRKVELAASATRVAHAMIRKFPETEPLKLRKGHCSREVRGPAIRPVHENSRRCHMATSNPDLENW